MFKRFLWNVSANEQSVYFILTMQGIENKQRKIRFGQKHKTRGSE